MMNVQKMAPKSVLDLISSLDRLYSDQNLVPIAQQYGKSLANFCGIQPTEKKPVQLFHPGLAIAGLSGTDMDKINAMISDSEIKSLFQDQSNRSKMTTYLKSASKYWMDFMNVGCNLFFFGSESFLRPILDNAEIPDDFEVKRLLNSHMFIQQTVGKFLDSILEKNPKSIVGIRYVNLAGKIKTAFLKHKEIDWVDGEVRPFERYFGNTNLDSILVKSYWDFQKEKWIEVPPLFILNVQVTGIEENLDDYGSNNDDDDAINA